MKNLDCNQIIYVGAKAQGHTMGLGPRIGRLTTFEKEMWVSEGLPAQLLRA